MATAAYMTSLAIFALGLGMVLTALFLAANALFRILRYREIRRERRMRRRRYEDWLLHGKLD